MYYWQYNLHTPAALLSLGSLNMSGLFFPRAFALLYSLAVASAWNDLPQNLPWHGLIIQASGQRHLLIRPPLAAAVKFLLETSDQLSLKSKALFLQPEGYLHPSKLPLYHMTWRPGSGVSPLKEHSHMVCLQDPIAVWVQPS